ncbi:HD domain-containing phosphohydrolase [Pectinatus frisingensis]|nr:HD domain-containing phosphohydrolase [Pectinatus frisingensis]
MQFSLNGFLLSISFALDCIERDILGVKLNHGKRVAYNALLIGQQMGMTQDDLVDMVAFSILHDNGISGCLTEHKLMDRKKVFLFENIKKHCTIGEKNIEDYPLLKKERNIILYHHERLDGSGYFHMKGDAIPLKAQILGLADYVDTHFKVNMMYGDYEERVIDHIKKLRNVKFSEKICDSFFKVIEPVYYRLDQEDANIEAALDKRAPYKFLDLDYFQIHEITAVFSRIIDTKSKFTWRHSKGLSEKAGIMAEFYDYSAEETVKLRIAADLHDIGKLLISNDILEAERRLTA